MFGRSRKNLELLKASVRGDAQAFEAVIGKYQSLVCAITYSATRNRAKSEELAQEVFLSAWKNLDQLQDFAKFPAWLCSIARNIVQNWLRGQSRDIVGKAAPLAMAAEQPSAEPGPLEAAVGKEEEMIVSRALARIPENFREPLVLFYREHRSVKQVAKQLGLSNTATRQRISRGRAMLREQVVATVERTITHTRPGKAFTVAVAAAVAGTAFKSASAAAAAPIGVVALSGTTAKIIGVAAGFAVVAVGIVAYTQLAKPSQPSASTVLAPARTSRQVTIDEVDAFANGYLGAGRDSRVRGAAAIEDQRPTDGGMLRQAGDLPAGRGRPTARGLRVVPGSTRPLRPVLIGTITDAETGQPVTDATVRVGGNARGFFTDANGFYSVEAGFGDEITTLTVDSNEHAWIPPGQDTQSTIRLAADRPVTKDFRLPKACMIDLWVVDPNGVKMPSAQVVVISPIDDYRRFPHGGPRPQTDRNGCLLLGGLPPTESHYIIWVWHPDYAATTATIRSADPDVIVQTTVTLDPGRTVPGHAEYADGIPAAGVRISVTSAWEYPSNFSGPGDTVKEDGAFTLRHLAPGTYSVGVQLANGRDLAVEGLRRVYLPPDDGKPLAVRLLQNSPKSLVSISGRLAYSGSDRPRRVSVEATRDSSTYIWGEVRPSPDGQIGDTFVIDQLEPGEYRLNFLGDDIERLTIDDVKAPSDNLQVQLVSVNPPAMTSLGGTVLDARTGKPVQTFRLRGTTLANLPGPWSGPRETWMDFQSEEGQFSLGAVGPGIYQVQAEADGYAPTWSDPINTSHSNSVRVLLMAGGTISGSVVDEAGKPITGAKIVPLSKAGGREGYNKGVFASEEGAVQSVGGAFTLKNLASGLETLRVSHRDYAPKVVEDIAVADGKTTGDISIVLSKGAAVEGFVYDDDGNPQGDQVLHFQTAETYRYLAAQTSWLATAVTNGNGFYHVEDLPEELCYVTRENMSYSRGVVQRTVVPTRTSVTRLDFGGQPVVSGTLIVDGTPLAKGQLTLGAADRLIDYGSLACITVTDERGRFKFRGVMPGTYGIYFAPPGKGGIYPRVKTFSMNSADVDLGTIDYKTTRLTVDVDRPFGRLPGRVSGVLLYQDDPPLSLGVPRRSKAPAAAGQPWIIEDAYPGTHYLTAFSDGMQYCKPITLEAGRDSWHASISFPVGTGAVAGHIRNVWPGLFDNLSGLWLCLIEPNAGYVAYRVDIDALWAFFVGNLPAGHYQLTSRFALQYGAPPLMEFDLAEGQAKVIDLDFSTCSPAKAGVLFLQVIDETGRDRSDAHVTVAGPGGPAPSVRRAKGDYLLVAEPGAYALSIDAPGYQPAALTVVLKPYDLLSPREQNVVVRLTK